MPERIGYARVSTDDQQLDLQRDALQQAGCVTLYEDVASGKNTARPDLAACLKALRTGDTLVVWRLDRLGRSLPDLIRIVGDLETKGVAFESLTEKIDTSSATGRLVFHLFGALAEFERSLTRERTHAGLAAARARGRVGGRKPKLDDKQIREIEILLANPEISVAQILERYQISKPTLYRALRAAQARREQQESKKARKQKNKDE